MTRRIDTLADIADAYDAVVFDQWGVLHNGTEPYKGALHCVETLAGDVAVLSNSGKRAAPNAVRIREMGFTRPFHTVMTSGEALWRDIRLGKIKERIFHAVERAPNDAQTWADGLDIAFSSLAEAEALLLMGLPDESALSEWNPLLQSALGRDLPVYCSNPDRHSPRAGGTVTSVGALAFAYKDLGGEVHFYGKPHRPIFDSLVDALGSSNLLMVGDSLEHDIAGAAGASWDSVFVGGGLYRDHFSGGDWRDALDALPASAAPTYFIGELR
ncbi:MAG: TIGR01459 family HAD-type hydrolase [Pseudomonadota bacterium]